MSALSKKQGWRKSQPSEECIYARIYDLLKLKQSYRLCEWQKKTHPKSLGHLLLFSDKVRVYWLKVITWKFKFLSAVPRKIILLLPPNLRCISKTVWNKYVDKHYKFWSILIKVHAFVRNLETTFSYNFQRLQKNDLFVSLLLTWVEWTKLTTVTHIYLIYNY